MFSTPMPYQLLEKCMHSMVRIERSRMHIGSTRRNLCKKASRDGRGAQVMSKGMEILPLILILFTTNTSEYCPGMGVVFK